MRTRIERNDASVVNRLRKKRDSLSFQPMMFVFVSLRLTVRSFVRSRAALQLEVLACGTNYYEPRIKAHFRVPGEPQSGGAVVPAAGRTFALALAPAEPQPLALAAPPPIGLARSTRRILHEAIVSASRLLMTTACWAGTMGIVCREP